MLQRGDGHVCEDDGQWSRGRALDILTLRLQFVRDAKIVRGSAIYALLG